MYRNRRMFQNREDPEPWKIRVIADNNYVIINLFVN